MDYSISIGIDHYLHLSETPFAENDATEFHKIMMNVFQANYHVLLVGNRATYKNIENEYQKIIDRIDADDRLIFFFAGHGKNLIESPYISTYDGGNTVDGIRNSWHNLLTLINKVNSTGCKKNIFFIDACESTIRLGSRENLDRFDSNLIDEMIKANSYSYVFSSCSHKGVADIYLEKEHGIWSYYLLKALAGQDPRALIEERRLTNNSLSNYLSINVKNHCKADPKCDIQQSHTWGKKEGEFLIIQFPETKLRKYDEVPEKSLKQVELVTIKFEGVRYLSGFVKGTHTIPKYHSQAVDRFISDIAAEDIREHIDSVTRSLKDLLGLKRRDFTVEYFDNAGTFKCPFFSYSYSVSICENDLSSVEFTASLLPHDISKLIDLSKDLDKCFPDWFDYLLFTMKKRINITDLIDKIEDLDQKILEDYRCEYDSECTYLQLKSKKLNRTFIITENELKIKFNTREEIIDMFESLKFMANQFFLISPTFNLLE